MNDPKSYRSLSVLGASRALSVRFGQWPVRATASLSPTMPPPRLPAPSLPPHPPQAPGALELPSRGSLVPLGRSRGPLKFSGSRWAQWPPQGKFFRLILRAGTAGMCQRTPLRGPHPFLSLNSDYRDPDTSNDVSGGPLRRGRGPVRARPGARLPRPSWGRPRWLNSHGHPSSPATSNDVAWVVSHAPNGAGFRCFVVP